MSATSKLVKAWESKANQRAVKAGSGLTMALTLAACGGSGTTGSDAIPVVEESSASTYDFKLVGGEQPDTGEYSSFTAVVAEDSDETSFDATDLLADADKTDNDDLTLVTEVELTASNTATVRNVEIINIDVDLYSGATANVFAADLTNFTAPSNVTVDMIAADTVIDTVTLTGIDGDAKVTVSESFDTLNATIGTAGDDLSIDMLHNDATVVVASGTAAKDVSIEAAGDLTATAATATGVVSATAAGAVTIVDANDSTLVRVDNTSAATAENVVITDSAAALKIDVASAGDATISLATAATDIDVVAAGDVSVTDSGVGSIEIEAGGIITLAESGSGDHEATSLNLSALGTSSVTTPDVTSMTVAGNGGDATYTMVAGSHAGLAEIVVAGDEDVTVSVAAADIAGALTVTDGSDAGLFTLDIGGTAGAVNTSGGDVIDQLNVNLDMSTSALSVASGQEVTFTVDQTGDKDLIVGVAAQAANNSVTINLDDEVANSAAVDLATLDVTQAKTVTVNVDSDLNTSGKSNITTLDVQTADASLTINTGSNGVTLTSGIIVGTSGNRGDLTLTGSDTATVSHAGLQADVDTYDASAMSGKVTMTGELVGDVTTVKTGSGNDTVILGVDTIVNIDTASGDDVLRLHEDYGTTTLTLEGGAGDNDKLEFIAGTKVSDLATGSSISGFETIQLFATGTEQEIDADLLNDADYNMAASATGADATVTVKIGSSDTDIDLSSLVESTDVANTVAGMTFIADASSNTAAIAYTGADGAKNTITGSLSGGDVLTGGAYADSFVVKSDGVLFNSSNVMLDTFVGGASAASTYDAFTVGTNGTAFEVVAADDFSKASGIEQITAVANSSAYSLTLGTSAEDAGITRIDISAAGTGDDNTVDVSDYVTTGVTITGSEDADTLTGGAGGDTITGGTGVDTITGGAGNDTITGGAAADVITGGAGDDTFSYGEIAELFVGTSSALVDASLAGGDGTDTISAGKTGTAFEVAANMEWQTITSVEAIAANANTASVSVTLHSSAHTAGIRTVDISEGTAASGNVVHAGSFTGLFDADLTLIGSATGVTTFTSGAGDDTITGGTAADIITGGAGADTIDVGTSVGADKVIISAAGQTAEWTNQTASTSVSITGMDVISGLDAGDDLALSAYTGTASATATDLELDSASGAYGSDLTVDVGANSFKFVRGDVDSNVFTESATGDDVLMAFDADTAIATEDYEALLLIGLGDNTFTLDSGAGGVISIA